MSSQTATQTQNRPAKNNRGRGRGNARGGGGGGGGRGGRGGGPRNAANHHPNEVNQTQVSPQDTTNGGVGSETKDQVGEAASAVDESTVCWICAEPVKYYSISQCNHRTCHVCALRLRALYKRMDCTFCKEPQPNMIFTASPDALWETFQPDDIQYKDPKLSVFFETQDMMEDTLILLRFNCPDTSCEFIANGWSDLKLHARATHGKLMCDLCIRHKKIFAHEHILYTPNHLPNHLPSMLRNFHRNVAKEQVDGGVHPFCEYCRECFFGDDELYAHMRERHEECFVCKRNEVRDQYFRNYDALEHHFTQAHHPCTQPACLARKFVVFGSALDLKAHLVEEHGADMSARDKKEVRRIPAEFEFQEVGGRRGGRRGGGGDRDRDRDRERDRDGERERERERDREPPPGPQPPQPPPSNLTVPGGPPRSGAGAGARRREAFGGGLSTGDGTPTAGGSRVPSRGQSPTPPNDVDTAVAERHATFLARVSSLAPNPNTAVPVVKAAARSYRANESTARDLISTVWNVLDRNLEGTASLVNALVDLLEDEDKKKSLLQAWNGFKVEQRSQFPALVPIGTGSEWAGITGGRILNAKLSTAAHSSAQSSRQKVQDRVARAAASSSTPQPNRPADRFPPLAPSSSTQVTSGFRQPQRNTPWAGSTPPVTNSPAPAAGPQSVPGPGSRNNGPAPNLSRSAFPELPTSSRRKPARGGGNQSLKNILGDTTPAVPAWQAGGGTPKSGSGTSTPTGTGALGEGQQIPEVISTGGTAAAISAPNDGSGTGGGGGGGGKKKGKGKQKQTLFTLGSFPT